MEKPVAVAIFAHPDDEAFGPGGTLYNLSKTHDVYLICATRGDKGQPTEEDRKLAQIRSAELRASARILGIKKVHFLNCIDGRLSNAVYHKIVQKITPILDQYKPELLITFEPRGITGHVDHMALSMITTYIFEHAEYAKRLWYYCIDEDMRAIEGNDYFIYFPPGYKQHEIDIVQDISNAWQIKKKAIQQHKSQKDDVDFMLQRMNQYKKKEEYFLEKTK